ncbi:serine hydrolase-like protein [Cherax quadricarinatus]|uniref:serine hydrolase-like protein n=1 Tax=Cherax quadricarinatus TaxID=27406 RepID=UPI00387E5501
MAGKDVVWHDISVDVGWGKLHGKTCIIGSFAEKNGTKILGVHGWLDNANTFDTLVPLLPYGVEVLVLDLPGHGLSDHLPLGAHYDPFTYAFNLRTAVYKLEWKKFILMGHSMGAAVSNYFTVLFPEYVVALINLDFIKPVNKVSKIEGWRSDASQLFKAEQEQRDPLVYSENEAIDRMVDARVFWEGGESHIDHDAAYVLLPRAARQVVGGYIWTHDPKARPNFLAVFNNDNWMTAISSVKCPVLLVRASDGVCIFPEKWYSKEMSAYHNNAKWFDVVEVKGKHHVHITHPERVAPAVSAFVNKVFKSFSGQLNAKL